MKKFRFTWLALIIMLGVLLTGCFGGKASEESTLTDGKKIKEASSEAVAVFKDNVKRLDNVSFDGDYLIVPDNVTAGDIVTFSYQGSNMAKKVSALDGNKATLEDAQIEEIFSTLEINDSIDLTTANLDKGSLPSGVVVDSVGVNAATGAFTSDSSGLKYYVSDLELIDYSKFSSAAAAALKAANVSVKVNGSVLLKKPTVDFSYSLFTKTVKLVINTGDTAELSLTGNANYEKMIIDKEIFLGNYVIPISAVGVPVGNLTFALTMSAGVNGKINFYARAYQNLDISVGIQGKYGSNSGISFIYPSKSDLERNLKYGYDARANANLDAWCALMPRASLTIFSYEMAAVRGDLGVQGHVEGEASSTAEQTSVTSSARLTATAKVYAKVEADFRPIPTEPKKTSTIVDWSKTFTGTWATK